MSIYDDFVYHQVDPCPSGSVTYTIRSGDTFYNIAQRFGTTVAVIISLNPGVNPNALQVGQQICIPSVGTAPGTCPNGIFYTIGPGDTFTALAARYGILLQELLAANPGVDPNRLMIGQSVCIPRVGPPIPTEIATPFCSLLQPIFSTLPPNGNPPFGTVLVYAVAMSTRIYAIFTSPLPNPTTLGNFNSYVGVLSLIQEDPSLPAAIVNVRLVPSPNDTWSGTITSLIPVVGDFAEIRPLNSTSGNQGAAILRGNFTSCRT